MNFRGGLVGLHEGHHDLDVAPRSSTLVEWTSLAQRRKRTAYRLHRPVGMMHLLDGHEIHTRALRAPLRFFALEPAQPVLYGYLLPPCRALCSRTLILSSISPNSFHLRSCSRARR